MSENVKSAVRTLRMLELFANKEKPLSLKQITSYLEMPKSSAFMLLNTLIREHYVEEVASGQFLLANALMVTSLEALLKLFVLKPLKKWIILLPFLAKALFLVV